MIFHCCDHLIKFCNVTGTREASWINVERSPVLGKVEARKCGWRPEDAVERET